MRVFLPTTLNILRSAWQAGAVGPAPQAGYAVTGSLREWYADGDEEELEYVALTMAARDSLRLLAADTTGSGAAEPDRGALRRAVLAVDVDRAHPDPDQGPGVVAVVEEVPLRRVGALLLDAAGAAADVGAAVEVLRAGGPRDDDEQFVVDGCEAHELAWYATQEIPDLL